MTYFLRFFVLLFILSTVLLASAAPWNGKWHVNWVSGVLVMHLEQHASDVNGTYEPSTGILHGKTVPTRLSR